MHPNHNSIEITNSLAFSGTKSVKGTWVNVNGGIDNPSILPLFLQERPHLCEICHQTVGRV